VDTSRSFFKKRCILYFEYFSINKSITKLIRLMENLSTEEKLKKQNRKKNIFMVIGFLIGFIAMYAYLHYRS